MGDVLSDVGDVNNPVLQGAVWSDVNHKLRSVFPTPCSAHNNSITAPVTRSSHSPLAPHLLPTQLTHTLTHNITPTPNHNITPTYTQHHSTFTPTLTHNITVPFLYWRERRVG